jgi:ELWxxDGT repeat protein
VLFNGYGGLWVTNGTTAGTYELTNISVADSWLGPLLSVFNNEVPFSGVDAAGHHGLWVTNGTAAGTYELTNISGALSGAIFPQDLTVFNNEVLFNGIDAAYLRGLWVTNGTAAGTYELYQITNISQHPFLFGLDPSDLTVFNNEVLFSGFDATANTINFDGDYPTGLWVTDGTTAGTYELTNISGAISDGLYPQDLASTANDTLYLNSGADTVVIGPGSGQDTILNFQTTQDTLQFSPSLFANYAAAMTSASQVGANTVFTIDANDTVTIQNVNMANLSAANFRFS